jgi:hypothetical protein
LKTLRTDEAAALPSPQVVLSCGSTGTTAASDAHPASDPLPGVTGYRTPRPIRRGVPHGCASRLFAASMAFTLISGARHSLLPPEGETSNDAAGFALCYGPHRRSPIRAFDAGLRPRPFPDETASLLPGLLAATRTGLPPASDDELTNTKKHHGTTSRCHLLLCWAHERLRLAGSYVTASCVAQI